MIPFPHSSIPDLPPGPDPAREREPESKEEEDAVDYSGLPDGLRDGARRWIEDGLIPGEFLQAVIRNDLLAATNMADPENFENLGSIVQWWWLEAPGLCWGSREKAKAWQAVSR